MFDAISVGSSSSVSCDEGLCDVSHCKLLCVCSRRNPRLRLRDDHPSVGGSSHSLFIIIIGLFKWKNEY
jgi:hypothetical protein